MSHIAAGFFNFVFLFSRDSVGFYRMHLNLGKTQIQRDKLLIEISFWSTKCNGSFEDICDFCWLIGFFTIGDFVRLSDRSLHRQEQTKISSDHRPNALPTELSQHSVGSLNLHGLYKSCSIDSRNEQSPTCEMVHEANKAHFRNLLPNRFLPSSVVKASD